MLNFSTLPLAKHQCSWVIIICLLSLFAFVFNDDVSTALVYNYAQIQNGELWRLFTGHFLHTNGYHLLLNLSAVILLWALHGQYYTWLNFSALFLFCALTTSLGIYFYSPQLHQYVGLSGVLHGIFVWGALMDIRHHEKTGYLLLIAVVAKILHEQLSGPNEEMMQLIDANVAIDAHLWGAIGGLIFGLIYLCFFYERSAKKVSSAKIV